MSLLKDKTNSNFKSGRSCKNSIEDSLPGAPGMSRLGATLNQNGLRNAQAKGLMQEVFQLSQPYLRFLTMLRVLFIEGKK